VAERLRTEGLACEIREDEGSLGGRLRAAARASGRLLVVGPHEEAEERVCVRTALGGVLAPAVALSDLPDFLRTHAL
jgi:hypothetical protein